MEHENDKTAITLPLSVVSHTDAGRVMREIQDIDEFLNQAAIREPGKPMKLPPTSKLVDEIIRINQFNALVKEDRAQLLNFMKSVQAHAPVLHMSFSADPSPLFTRRLITWLRNEIHPLTLLRIGLQPDIGAGCAVRTINKHFDFSLRHRFAARKDFLTQRIRGAISEPKAQQAPPAAPQAAAAEASK